MVYQNRGYQDYKITRRKRKAKWVLGLGLLMVIVFLLYKFPIWRQFFPNKDQSFDFENNLCVDASEPVGAASLSRSWLIKDSPYVAQEATKTTYTFNSAQVDSVLGVYLTVVGEEDYQILNPSLPFSTEYKTDFSVEEFETGHKQLRSYIYTDDDCYLSSPIQTLNVSRPLYVAMTIDWEGYDISNDNLRRLEDFSETYGFSYTHFFNPRIYLPKAVDPKRASYITDWLKNRSSVNGDAIGLHLHMFYDMVAEAGVTPKRSPRWDYRTTGSDVPSSEYGYEDYKQMLEWSKRQFSKNGLATPTSFRAGGWFIDEDNLQALADAGFRYDSSARVKNDLGAAKLTTPWDIKVTTKPYQISESNQNSDQPSPLLDLWQFPNNGLESNRLNASELINNFDANYANKPLTERGMVTYLLHPHDLQKHIFKMEKTYEYIDTRKAINDGGPVVFITLDQAYEEFAN